MRETASPERLRHLRERIGTAAAELETAKEALAARRRQLAEEACPWQPGDFVRQAITGTVPEIPHDNRYRVEKVHPGDPDPLSQTDWTLEVRDRAGNRFIFAESVALTLATPWEGA